MHSISSQNSTRVDVLKKYPRMVICSVLRISVLGLLIRCALRNWFELITMETIDIET
jgi:hypothetical protein